MRRMVALLCGLCASVACFPARSPAQTKLLMHDAAGAISGYKVTNTSQGAALTTGVTNSVAGPTAGVQMTKTAGGSALAWISAPLASAVTISGTVTLNGWALESNGTCNCGVEVRVYKYSGGSEGAAFLTSEKGTELTTSAALQNWTATPTSTAFAAGDRIVLKWWINDAGGTMSSGRTVTMDYDGATGGSDGDTYVSFTEAISFSSEGGKARAGAGSLIHMTGWLWR